MKYRMGLVAAFLLLLGVMQPAQAGFVSISNPGNAVPGGGTYLSTTNLMPVSAAEFSTVSSLSSAGFTVSFSTAMQVLQVGSGWDTWNSPPFTENSTPTVLFSQGLSQVTLSLNQAVTTFGFELQPNDLAVFLVTATFFNGASTLGTISRNVDGNGGALLFAGTVTSPTLPITSVRISTGGTDFAIADLRYRLQGASAVPEPGTLTLLGLGVLGLAGYGWRRKNGRASAQMS